MENKAEIIKDLDRVLQILKKMKREEAVLESKYSRYSNPFICNNIIRKDTLDYFRSQRPTSNLHPEFFYHNEAVPGLAWFNNSEEGLNLRIEFLKKIISELKK